MTSSRFTFTTKRAVVLTLVVILLAGCAAYMKDRAASRNRDRLASLQLGMTQEQVLEHMGEPWKREAFLKDGQAYTVLYYVTQRIHDDTTTDEEMTPVVLREGRLVGWGRRFFSDLRIEVRQEKD